MTSTTVNGIAGTIPFEYDGLDNQYVGSRVIDPDAYQQALQDRRDSQQIRIATARANAPALAQMVANGQLSDCQALVAFVSDAVYDLGLSADELYQALGIFVPSDNLNVQRAGLPSVPDSQRVLFLNSGNQNVSGFLPQYQDSQGLVVHPHEDQTHHFAAFFELGYKFGSTAATASAFVVDSPLDNSQDVALGIAAGQLGASARTDLFDLPTAISNQLCDPNWVSRTQP